MSPNPYWHLSNLMNLCQNTVDLDRPHDLDVSFYCCPSVCALDFRPTAAAGIVLVTQLGKRCSCSIEVNLNMTGRFQQESWCSGACPLKQLQSRLDEIDVYSVFPIKNGKTGSQTRTHIWLLGLSELFLCAGCISERKTGSMHISKVH